MGTVIITIRFMMRLHVEDHPSASPPPLRSALNFSDNAHIGAIEKASILNSMLASSPVGIRQAWLDTTTAEGGHHAA
jgi:hypothetical protein